MYIFNGHKVYIKRNNGNGWVPPQDPNLVYWALYLHPKDPRYQYDAFDWLLYKWVKVNPANRQTNRLIIEALTWQEVQDRFNDCQISPPYIVDARPRKTNKTRSKY